MADLNAMLLTAAREASETLENTGRLYDDDDEAAALYNAVALAGAGREERPLRLLTFAERVLGILDDEDEWGADTLAAIGSAREELGLRVQP